jgi:hypothetical protein
MAEETQQHPKFVKEDGKFDQNAYRKWRYHNDPDYKARHISNTMKALQKKKLNQDFQLHYKNQVVAINADRYQNDETFRLAKQEYGRNYYAQKQKEKDSQKSSLSTFSLMS